MIINGPSIDPWSGPVRPEVLNENPRIVRFYEVMHDWEIEHIRSISQNVMERSQVLDKGGRAKSYERNVFQNRQKIWSQQNWHRQMVSKNPKTHPSRFR